MHLISKIKSCSFNQHFNTNHKKSVGNKYGESYTSLHVSNSFKERILVIAFIKDMNMHIQLHKLITTCGRWREENLRSAKRWMNKLGSTGFCMTGCCSSRSSWHNCRNTAPNTYLHCASHAPIQYFWEPWLQTCERHTYFINGLRMQQSNISMSPKANMIIPNVGIRMLSHCSPLIREGFVEHTHWFANNQRSR